MTETAFNRFLDCLSEDREEAGQIYARLHQKLIDFFTWRGFATAEELADEAIDRVVRKIDAGDPLQDPATFVFGVARLVALEASRAQTRLANLPVVVPAVSASQDAVDQEARLACLHRCLGKLPAEDRDLLVRYYSYEGREKITFRKELAERFGTTVNTIRVRTHRLRERLETCLTACLKKI